MNTSRNTDETTAMHRMSVTLTGCRKHQAGSTQQQGGGHAHIPLHSHFWKQKHKTLYSLHFLWVIAITSSPSHTYSSVPLPCHHPLLFRPFSYTARSQARSFPYTHTPNFTPTPHPLHLHSFPYTITPSLTPTPLPLRSNLSPLYAFTLSSYLSVYSHPSVIFCKR